MDVLDNMAMVRQKRGLPAIDPTRIEGFGPGAPPVPEIRLDHEIPGAEAYEDPDPPSPLIALGKKPEPSTASLPEPKLMVVDGNAVYAGQAAVLSGPDQAAIGRIVLEAVQRKLREQLAEVRRQAPRRVRKAAVVEGPKRGRRRRVDAVSGAA